MQLFLSWVLVALALTPSATSDPADRPPDIGVVGVAHLGARLLRAGLRGVPGFLRGLLPGLLLLAAHRVRAVRQVVWGRPGESTDLTIPPDTPAEIFNRYRDWHSSI